MRPFDAVFFDYDGTLCDSMGMIYQGVCNVLVQSGVPVPTIEKFLAVFRVPYLPFYRSMGVTAPVEMIREWYFGAVDHVSAPLFPDSIPILQELRSQDLIVGMVSANRDHIVRQRLEQDGIFTLFNFIYCNAEEKSIALREGLKKNGLAPNKTAYIGDIASDMSDARTAGVIPIGITRGYPSRQVLQENGAEHVITHLDELLPIVRNGNLRAQT